MEKALRELGQHQSGHRLIAYIDLYWRGNIVYIMGTSNTLKTKQLAMFGCIYLDGKFIDSCEVGSSL